MKPVRKHFHTFDGLRFISFLLVFLHHSPHSESGFIAFFTKSGGVGVSFFFVLSGFLITYILLTEKMATDKIALGKFFIRRILRIWPLFYGMILFAFLTPCILDFLEISYSNEGYTPDWGLSLLFLENYKMMWTETLPNVSPLGVMWSLCIEEHFYIIWGLAFYVLPIGRIPVLIVVSLIGGAVCRGVYDVFGIQTLDVFSNIDSFAFGAIPAYLFLFHQDLFKKIGKIPVVLKVGFFILGLLLAFALPGLEAGWLQIAAPTIYGIAFSGIILFTLTETNPLRIKDRWLISKLGIYTYGLYLFHTIVINFLLQISSKIPFEVNYFMTGIAALLLTILISIASYHLFEKRFLKLKKYFYP